MIRQMTASRDTSASAYVHLPAGTPFFTKISYLESWAVELRGKLSPDAVWHTQDGWIYQDWQILLPFGGRTVVGNIKPGTDGIWRYEYDYETYPLLCRPVNWAELELLHTFR